MIFFNFSLKD